MTTKSLLTMAESVNNVFTAAVRHLPSPHSDPISNGVDESSRLFNALSRDNPQMARAILLSMDSGRSSMFQYHFLACWRSFGFPVFKVTGDLAAALLLTDYQDLCADDLAFPFDSFVIDLPRELSLEISKKTGQPSHVTSVMLHKFYARSESGTIHPCLLSMTCDSDNEYTQRHDVLPLPGERIGKLLGGGTSDEFDDVECRSLRTVTRIAINLCLYLASLPTRQWEKHSGRIRYNQKNRPEVTEWAVGREIKLPRTLIDAAKAFAADGKDRSAWRVKSRFIVRGHWRMQACGKELSERKKIWIHPFEKGPVDAAMLTRRYQVDTTNEGVTT